MSTQWETIKGPVSVSPQERIYLICRSHTKADEWAKQNYIHPKNYIWAPSLYHIAGVKQHSLIFVLTMKIDPTHFLDEVREKMSKFPNLKMVEI